MSEPWLWQDVGVAVSLGLAIPTGGLIVASEERRAGLRFGKAGPLLSPEVVRWVRRDRIVRLTLVAIFVATVSFAGLVYLGGEIEKILVTNAGWGTGPRCFWSEGQLVLCGSPAERDAALREEAIRNGSLTPRRRWRGPRRPAAAGSCQAVAGRRCAKTRLSRVHPAASRSSATSA